MTHPVSKISKPFKRRQKLKLSEISIWIDTYDDIFSDFDPRPYSERTISTDFLDEVRQASKLKSSGNLELKILVPKDIRNEHNEHMVKDRLLDYFKRHFDQSSKEMRSLRRTGLMMAMAGELMIVLAAYLSKLLSELFWVHFLIVTLEPAGWFLTWSGLERFLYETKIKKSEVSFLEKMSLCDINFWSL